MLLCGALTRAEPEANGLRWAGVSSGAIVGLGGIVFAFSTVGRSVLMVSGLPAAACFTSNG
jgi:hypothetical protein